MLSEARSTAADRAVEAIDREEDSRVVEEKRANDRASCPSNRTKRRLVYIHQHFLKPSDSGGTRSYEMAKRLSKEDYEVHIVGADRKSTAGIGRWSTEELDGFHVHLVGVPYSNAMSFLARVRVFAVFAVLSTLRAIQLKGDIVLATSTPLTVAIPGIIASRFRRVPFVFEVRDVWPELPIALGVLKSPALKGIAKFLEKKAYQNSERVISLSPGMTEGIKRSGVRGLNIDLIPNSADIDLFRRSDIDAEEFLRNFQLPSTPMLLYAGTVGRANGVRYLVDMAYVASVEKLPFHIVVIGDGAEKETLLNSAERLGVLNKQIYFIPRIAKSEIVSAFSAASACMSVFVDVKELEDNSANKVFDAMAAGKPILINYGGWQKELIEAHGIGAVLSRDAKTAARQAARCLSDLSWQDEAGKAAWKLARSTYSRDEMSIRLRQTLDAAIASFYVENQ